MRYRRTDHAHTRVPNREQTRTETLPAGPATRQLIGPASRTWHVVARHRDRLVVHARRCGAGHDAEDVAQEAKVRGVLSATLDHGRPLSYLLRIVENLTRSSHRRASVAAQAVHRLTDPGAATLPTEEQAVLQDLARRVVRRLRETEPATTVQLVLHRSGGASWPELAAEFDLTEKCAESRVRRATSRVRRWLVWQLGEKDLAELRRPGT